MKLIALDGAVAQAYAIRSIPVAWLVDRNGYVVDTKARGEKLEPLVRQLLGLTAASE